MTAAIKPFQLTPDSAREGDLIRACLAVPRRVSGAGVASERRGGLVAEQRATAGAALLPVGAEGEPGHCRRAPALREGPCSWSARAFGSRRRRGRRRARRSWPGPGAVVLEVRSLEELRVGLRAAGVER